MLLGSRSTPRRIVAAAATTILAGIMLTLMIIKLPYSGRLLRHSRDLSHFQNLHNTTNVSGSLAFKNTTIGSIKIKEHIPGWPYPLLINDPNACRDDDIYLLNTVTSNPSQVYHREMIRNMWGRKDIASQLKIKTVFIVGKVPSDITQQHLMEENDKYGDIIQFDFLETRKNLTIKSLAAIHWFRAYCPNATWVLKVDVDAYVNFWALLEVLRPVNDTKDAVCSRSLSRIVCREANEYGCYPHYVVTPEEYPLEVYPPYCQGYAYIFHKDFADRMLKLDQQRTGPPFWIEDVYVTGLLTRNLRPRWLDIRRHSEVTPYEIESRFYDGKMFFIHDLEGQIGQGATNYVWNKTLQHYNITLPS
ncbi:UDP-GlcNAc betaGal beta-1,3-N-acetylglucosaminyltransferase 7 [Halocaridina rubra]|uniref:Hexosyltransferase n=1 Tax=Halocaridina rubra TaxID=373956 RepID=A0AAN8XD54_HALRR